MKGVIIAIHGDVVKIEFSGGLPNISDSLIVTEEDGTNIILEVHDHIIRTGVKAIALGYTQGMKRGIAVIPSGSSLQVPAGKNCLGRATIANWFLLRQEQKCLRFLPYDGLFK